MPMESAGPGDPGLRAYIRQALAAKAQREGFQPTPQEMEEATEHYAKTPGNEYRQGYYRTQAIHGRGEAQQAALGGGFGDVLERTGRDIGSGFVKGLTAPGRFVAHQVGIGDPAAEAQAFESMSGDSMGGRGLSSNPILGTIQSAVGPAAEMAGSMPAANLAMKMTGNVLTKGAQALPKSQVMQALGRAETTLPQTATMGERAMAIGKQTPRAAVKGTVGGVVSTPEETLQTPQGLGQTAMLSMLDALEAGVTPGPAGGPGMLRRGYGAINDFFEAPKESGSFPEMPAGTPRPVGEIPPQVPDATQAAGPAAPATPEVLSAPTAKVRGGDPVDWTNLDLNQAEQARNAWAQAKTPQERAILLGAEREMGMEGVPPTSWVVESITKATSPDQLLGFLQKGLIRKVTGQKPIYTNKVSKRTGKMTPKAPSAETVIEMPTRAETVQQMVGEERGAAPGVTAGIPTPAASMGAIPEAPAAPARKLKTKRQDVLKTAARMEDGTLDWDKLDMPQREAVAGMLGAKYRGKILNMSMANIQKTLNNAQFESFFKALKRQPRAEAAPTVEGVAPETPMTPAPEAPVTAALEPEVLVPGTVSPRKGKGVPISAPEAPTVAPLQDAGSTPHVEAAPTMAMFDPGGYDKADAAGRSAQLTGAGVSPDRARAMAAFNFDLLPRALKSALEKSPVKTAPSGGAAQSAPFPEKRSAKAKRPPV